METYLQTWGYLASFVGTLLEGEILLLSAIVAAKMGYMNIFGTLTALFAGAYVRDWLTFLTARKTGKYFVNKRPALKAKLNKVSDLMNRYPTQILLSYRMLYGFTTAIVLLLGLSNISNKKFALFAALSNLIWLSIYGSLSYFCAEFLTENINWVSENKLLFVGSLALIGLCYWFFVKRKKWRLDRESRSDRAG